MPVSKLAKGGQTESGVRKLAQSKIMDIVRRFDPSAEVNVISDNKVQVRVSKEAAPRVIGKGGIYRFRVGGNVGGQDRR